MWGAWRWQVVAPERSIIMNEVPTFMQTIIKLLWGIIYNSKQPKFRANENITAIPITMIKCGDESFSDSALNISASIGPSSLVLTSAAASPALIRTCCYGVRYYIQIVEILG